MKGILLAGGSGTRLYPLTQTISKQLLPVYNKPTLYYPLSTLMLSGAREVMVISTPRDLPFVKNLLGDGSKLGMTFEYAEQKEPKGIAEALIIAESFISGKPCCLILGDNIFYGAELMDLVRSTASRKSGAEIYAYRVNDPERYGVVEFDAQGNALSIEEKPKQPKSNFAVTGLYFYDEHASRLAKTLKPSNRGELEITDLNKLYLQSKALTVTALGRGFAWLDTGTFDSLISSATFVQTIEQRTGLMVGCIEEVAFRQGWIGKEEIEMAAHINAKSEYGNYLKSLLNEPKL